MSRIFINVYPFDEPSNRNVCCLLAYAVASVVAGFMSLRFEVPDYDPATHGRGAPDAVFVRKSTGHSMRDIDFFHVPAGSQPMDEGRVAGALLGYEWEVYYRHRRPAT